MERSKNSLRNILFGLTGQVINILMSFVTRTVFLRTLSSVYLGVNGLFTNILMVFSLADLGVGTAIIYALYRPIAEGDRRKIQALMNMYQRAYLLIGCVILLLGLGMMPFIKVFVKTTQDIPNLRLIFMIFVVNTASTYFFAYKGTLITAHQRNYIVTNVVYTTSILCYAVQIVIMKATHNYILTLSIQVGTNILQNIITMAIANRMYPYIKQRNNELLAPEERRKIYRNMSSLMFYRTGQVVINGTDSITISSLVGVTQAGIYSNYLLLTTTVKNLMQQVFSAITASIGNLAAMESNEMKYQMYKSVYFGNFWMFGFGAVCFFVLFNPFMILWAGVDMMLSSKEVFFISLNFYLIGMRNVNLVFRDTMGVFREGRFVPIISAAVNIGVSVIATIKFGLIGAFIGTTISMVTTLVWMEPVVLFKYGFKRKVWPYFVKYLIYFSATALATAITWLIAHQFTVNSLSCFIGKLVVCLITPNLLFFLLFGRTKEFQLVYEKVMAVTKSRLKKRRAAK